VQPCPCRSPACALGSGTFAVTQTDKSGARVLARNGLTPTNYAGPFGYAPRDYLAGMWTSAWQGAGFPFLELVSSWNAETPLGTWIQVEMRATAAGDGHTTKWYVLGRWAYGDADIHRTSVGGQGDKDGYVAIDTFVPKNPMSSYQLRLTLFRASGTTGPLSVTR